MLSRQLRFSVNIVCYNTNAIITQVSSTVQLPSACPSTQKRMTLMRLVIIESRADTHYLMLLFESNSQAFVHIHSTMSATHSSSSTKEFAYDTLPDIEASGSHAPHIRLIEVHGQNTSDKMIQASIHCTSVEHAPSYQAISYTWGDENAPERIHVKSASSMVSSASRDVTPNCGGYMTVRKNCADVLRQLAHFKTSRYYWVDAICIDQQNIEEKGVQVGRMGEIFRQADSVLVCIGMHDESSQFLASMLKSFQLQSSEANFSIHVLNGQQYPHSSSGNRLGQRNHVEGQSAEELLREQETCVNMCYDWLHSIDDADFRRFYRALQKLAQRSYFWRIWTLQELWVAHRVRILCDYDELPLSILLFWWSNWRFVVQISNKFSRLRELIHQKLGIGPSYENQLLSGLGDEYEKVLAQRQSGLTEGSASAIEQLSRGQLLNICFHRKCQDRRDIVYGTLAITNWTAMEVRMPDGTWITDEDENAPISPDYSLSAYELAKKLMPRFDTLSSMERMCNALYLNAETEEVQIGVTTRNHVLDQQFNLALSEDWHWSQNSQNLARVSLEAFRLGSGSGSYYQFDHLARDSTTFTRIFKDSEECQAIASGEARDGDWVVCTVNGEALVLRECGDYLHIIGKAVFAASFQPVMQNVTVWFGVEDLLILLIGHREVHWLGDVDFDSDGHLADNKESVLSYLNSRVCGELNSSFAILGCDDRAEEDSGKSSSRLTSYRLRSVHSSWKRLTESPDRLDI